MVLVEVAESFLCRQVHDVIYKRPAVTLTSFKMVLVEAAESLLCRQVHEVLQQETTGRDTSFFQ